MNASSAPNVASGCSSCGRCPAWLMTVNCACEDDALAPFGDGAAQTAATVTAAAFSGVRETRPVRD